MIASCDRNLQSWNNLMKVWKKVWKGFPAWESIAKLARLVSLNKTFQSEKTYQCKRTNCWNTPFASLMSVWKDLSVWERLANINDCCSVLTSPNNLIKVQETFSLKKHFSLRKTCWAYKTSQSEKEFSIWTRLINATKHIMEIHH